MEFDKTQPSVYTAALYCFSRCLLFPLACTFTQPGTSGWLALEGPNGTPYGNSNDFCSQIAGYRDRAETQGVRGHELQPLYSFVIPLLRSKQEIQTYRL